MSKISSLLQQHILDYLYEVYPEERRKPDMLSHWAPAPKEFVENCEWLLDYLDAAVLILMLDGSLERNHQSWRRVWYKLSTNKWLEMTRSRQQSLTISTSTPRGHKHGC